MAQDNLWHLKARIREAAFGMGDFEGEGFVDFWQDDIDQDGLVEQVIRPFLERAYSDGFKAAQAGAKKVKERNPYHDYGDRAVNDVAE